jgi:hypothetical protein
VGEWHGPQDVRYINARTGQRRQGGDLLHACINHFALAGQEGSVIGTCKGQRVIFPAMAIHSPHDDGLIGTVSTEFWFQ